MAISSLQVCMDSSDWFQGTIPQDEENNTQLIGILDSTTSSPMSSNCMTPPSAAGDDSGGILVAACNRPGGLIERRLRPQHEQALKCPRCDSTHTKFCYYNNYSLSQPRYFCKTCRRYWTKGGTLRNIPVGGGCRKNTKKPSSSTSSSSNNNNKKSSSSSINLDTHHHHPSSSSSPSLLLNNGHTETDLQLANFSDQMNFTSLHAGLFNPINANFLLENSINNNNTPFHEFMENKYESLVGPAGSHGFLGESSFNGGFHHPGMNICSPFGMAASSSSILDHGMNINSSSSNLNHVSVNEGGGNILERLMLPFDQNHDLDNHNNYNHNQMNIHHHHHETSSQDVKPNPKILSLEWHEHNNFGGLGSWTGLMNGYGSSAANPLV